MRSLLAAAAVLLALPALAADDPPKGGGTVQMLIAKVDGDNLVTTSSSTLPRSVTVKDGDQQKTITVTETNSTSTGRPLKNIRATDTEDKEIPAADFKDKMKSGGLVVWMNSPLDATWKAKFKRGTVFAEYVAAKDEPKKEDPK